MKSKSHSAPDIAVLSKHIDQLAIKEMMGLGFIKEASNVVMLGPNGVGKSTLAKNIAHQGVVAGHTVLFTTAATIVTTNKPFAQWSEVFPNASCVVSLVDRLVHHAEILQIDGESYRMREAKEAAALRQKNRQQANRPGRGKSKAAGV